MLSEVGVRANSDRFKRMMMSKEEEQLRRIQGENRRTSPISTATNRHISVLQKVPRIKATIIRNYLAHYQTKKSWFQMNFYEMNTKSNNNSDLLLNNIKVKYKAIGLGGENLNVTKAIMRSHFIT